jgi:asparagine synthase (glutamine-hydrolysing)
MPGIAGLITKMPRHEAEAQLLKMVEALRHESFYQAGTWIDETAGLYVGWVVQKNSFADGMPLHNERGDVTIIFSGEEYPGPGNCNRSKQQAGASDSRESSYLVRLYEQNQSFPLGLNGMFHGLVADRRNGTATLFNDIYGMHRILYHESKDAFYFAAEAKAILAVRPELRAPDPQSIGEFVALSCVLENRTIFKEIHAMPAASAWVFRDVAIDRKSTYFDPREWEEQTPLDAESYYQELREVFSGNLPRYFAGHEQIGMTLTGGLDTRVIMAWHKSAPGSLPCYTFGSMYRENQDVRIARRVARVCQQPHEVITVGKEFLERFPHYAERAVYLTEGTVDLYRASDLYVSEKARAIAPAKVVGTYGSEIVLRSVMFKPARPGLEFFRPEFLSFVDQAAGTYAAIRHEHPVTFAAFRQSPWYHHGILALEQSQLSVRSPYMDNDFVRTVYRAPKDNNTVTKDVRIRLIRDGSAALASFYTDRGIGGNSGPLLSSAARGYLEFTFKAEYAYDYGMPQWLTRMDHYFSHLHFERLFLGRHKLLHFRVWYRDALSKFVRDVLLDSRTLGRPYLDRKGVESVVHGHLSGTRNCTTDIHKLLTLELVQRLFFDAR